jgi:hypothetical protein
MVSKHAANPTNKMMAYRLSQIKAKMAALQQEQGKIRHDWGQGLSQYLIEAEAFEVDFDTLVGGILEVIAEAKSNTSRAEGWRKSGLIFQQNQNLKEREKGSHSEAKNQRSQTRTQEGNSKSI